MIDTRKSEKRKESPEATRNRLERVTDLDNPSEACVPCTSGELDDIREAQPYK
jgi:hypothetical protein